MPIGSKWFFSDFFPIFVSCLIPQPSFFRCAMSIFSGEVTAVGALYVIIMFGDSSSNLLPAYGTITTDYRLREKDYLSSMMLLQEYSAGLISMLSDLFWVRSVHLPRFRH